MNKIGNMRITILDNRSRHRMSLEPDGRIQDGFSFLVWTTILQKQYATRHLECLMWACHGTLRDIHRRLPVVERRQKQDPRRREVCLPILEEEYMSETLTWDLMISEKDRIPYEDADQIYPQTRHRDQQHREVCRLWEPQRIRHEDQMCRKNFRHHGERDIQETRTLDSKTGRWLKIGIDDAWWIPLTLQMPRKTQNQLERA